MQVDQGNPVPDPQNNNGQGQQQVQLSGAQLEEAKMLTANKMKVFRKDRLFAQDKEKVECLHDVLKGVRITDESAYFNS